MKYLQSSLSINVNRIYGCNKDRKLLAIYDANFLNTFLIS